MKVRTKMRKSAELAAELSFDALPARTLPPVLTGAAVQKGLMPPLGTSALPPSLESAVPAALRYWTAKSEEEARAVRDELVERDVIRASDILKVDGQPKRVTWTAYLAEEDPTPKPLLARKSVELAGAERLAFTPEPVVAVDATDDPGAWTAERVAKTVENLGERTLLAVTDTPAHRAALAKLESVFVLDTRPGVVFGATIGLDADASHATRVDVSPAVEKSHTVRLLRKADAEPEIEERYILGIVLEPNVVDSQKDTYDEATVRKAAHGFMENHQQIGKQHAEIVTGQIKILESFIAPVDFSVGTEKVSKGTWLLAVRVVSDELWTATKAGSYTGFSIGGTAIRTPDGASGATS